MVLGYAYPAYKCYKVVEQEEPKAEQLLFWCRYWYKCSDSDLVFAFSDLHLPHCIV